ncbi:hypothetical protein DL96DRAFT_1587094 [Flagelloscypha sp. PMI_526]|nr:hypothetical protein DL96DRAFT_1587094 [Flagelloscypha sp. PMI_526]
MKVIIIGGGVAALAFYHGLEHFLRDCNPNLELEVHIYESRTNSSLASTAALGLAANGLRVISKLSPEALAHIQDQGFECPAFQFRNAQGKFIGQMKQDSKETLKFSQLMIRRSAIHEGLMNGIPNDVIQYSRKVVNVVEIDQGVRVEFQDGNHEIADLVVGADGVHSIVRKCLLGPAAGASYSGLVGIGGFIPASGLAPSLVLGEEPEMLMTFGPNGFFGISRQTNVKKPMKETQLGWWSTFSSETPPDPSMSVDGIREKLLTMHAWWKSPRDGPDGKFFRSVIELGCTDERVAKSELLVLPRFEMKEIEKGRVSGSGRIVLVGDAAQVMPPDSGQGVSCAVEDVVAYCAFLKSYIGPGTVDLPQALEKTACAYDEIRIPRVNAILAVGRKYGARKFPRDLGEKTYKSHTSWPAWKVRFGEKMRDMFLGIACKMSPSGEIGQLLRYEVEDEVNKYLRDH